MGQTLRAILMPPHGNCQIVKVDSDLRGLTQIGKDKSALVTEQMVFEVPWSFHKRKYVIIPSGSGEGLNIRQPDSDSGFSMQMVHDLDHDRTIKELGDALQEEEGVKMEEIRGWIMIILGIMSFLILTYVAISVTNSLEEVKDYLYYIKPPPPPPPAAPA